MNSNVILTSLLEPILSTLSNTVMPMLSKLPVASSTMEPIDTAIASLMNVLNRITMENTSVK